MEILILIGVVAAIAFAIGRASNDSKIEAVQSQLDEAKRKSVAELFEVKRQSKAELATAEEEVNRANDTLRDLRRLYDNTVSEIRKDSVLLPSLARWAETLQHDRDQLVTTELMFKKHPARKAADEVRKALALARQTKRELDVALNRIDFYESIAPWLSDYTTMSVGELIDAIREESEAEASAERGEDPVSRYVHKAEWARLAPAERNQLALDRYCDPRRKRTPWLAGIQYERYIGFAHEIRDYKVKYQGAVSGRRDLGLDLICENSKEILAIQCKRLSVEKGIPVRENVVAQIFGSAQFYQMDSAPSKPVRPVLVTTYKLSDEAKRFATHLGVEVREFVALTRYPMIKCNISHGGRERIYHLPMDQQYDTVVIGDIQGEFYASTVKEAEDAGFRRALRWKGASE